MEIRIRITDDIELRGEVATPVDAWQLIIDWQQALKVEPCAYCHSEKARYAIRVVDSTKSASGRGGTFYEAVCTQCGATLSFTSSKQRPGWLFPRRYNYATGEPVGVHGWVERNASANAPEPHGDDFMATPFEWFAARVPSDVDRTEILSSIVALKEEPVEVLKRAMAAEPIDSEFNAKTLTEWIRRNAK